MITKKNRKKRTEYKLNYEINIGYRKWRTIKITRHENARQKNARHENAGHDIAGHKNSWHETIAYLLWSYRVLVRNVVVWCSTLRWFCTLGPNVFFCIVCVWVIMKITVIVILNKKCSLTNEELVKAVVLFRAFNVISKTLKKTSLHYRVKHNFF